MSTDDPETIVPREWLEELFLEGLASGSPMPLNKAEWADTRREVRSRLETLLSDGLASGDPIEMTPEWWAEKRTRQFRRTREE